MENNNPWKVESMDFFLCWKCPECSFDTQGEDDFQEHAVENHPLSHVFFGTVKIEEEDNFPFFPASFSFQQIQALNTNEHCFSHSGSRKG